MHHHPSSYQAFLARLNHPDSSSLLRSLKLFIRNALAASTLTLDELAESTRNFFYETEAAIAAHPQWAGCDPAELERAADGVEKYVMTRLHDVSFAAVPSEAAEDEQLTTWLQRLRFLRVDHLAISPEFRTLQPWAAAQQELGRICTYKTPRDKLVCILNCCKRINSALSQASNGGHGADEFFPVLLYVTVQAAPAGLHASLQYISRFRHPSKLVSEAAYYLTHQQSAISFLSNVQPEQLNIESAEFEAGLAETHAAIEKQKAEAAEAKAVAEAEAAAAAEAKAEAEAAAAEAAEPEAAEAAVENGSSATTPTAERQRLPSQNGGSNGTTTTTSSSYAAAAASARGTASAFFATLLENSPSGPSKLFDSRSQQQTRRQRRHRPQHTSRRFRARRPRRRRPRRQTLGCTRNDHEATTTRAHRSSCNRRKAEEVVVVGSLDHTRTRRKARRSDNRQGARPSMCCAERVERDAASAAAALARATAASPSAWG